MRVSVPVQPNRRGAAVRVGNVYACNRAPAFNDFRIVVGAGAYNRRGKTAWNRIVLLHVDKDGEVVGCSRQPSEYISNHWDLVGRVSIPTLKMEFT